MEAALALGLRARGGEGVELLLAQLAPRVGRGGPDDLLVVLLKQVVEVFVRVARVEQFVAAALLGVVEEIAEALHCGLEFRVVAVGEEPLAVLVGQRHGLGPSAVEERAGGVDPQFGAQRQCGALGGHGAEILVVVVGFLCHLLHALLQLFVDEGDHLVERVARKVEVVTQFHRMIDDGNRAVHLHQVIVVGRAHETDVGLVEFDLRFGQTGGVGTSLVHDRTGLLQEDVGLPDALVERVPALRIAVGRVPFGVLARIVGQSRVDFVGISGPGISHRAVRDPDGRIVRTVVEDLRIPFLGAVDIAEHLRDVGDAAGQLVGHVEEAARPGRAGQQSEGKYFYKILFHSSFSLIRSSLRVPA